MTTTASIAELRHAGVTLEAGEAVAVAQQLIQTLRDSDGTGGVQPPFGPPTASNVILNADGSVSCAACGTTPAISEIAIFLDALLPADSPRVPGALRYTIARGLLEVDVAPFDSLDDFSHALVRHERGPRGEVVRRLLHRAESARAAARGARADRRRTRTTDLRRALREADARLYAHQLAAAMPPSSQRRFGAPRRSWRSIFGASGGGRIAAPPGRPRNLPVIAACLGSGLMLIAAGEFIHGRPRPQPAAAPVVAPVAATACTSPGTTIAPAPPATEPATIERTDDAGTGSQAADVAARSQTGDAPTGARAVQARGGGLTRAANRTRPVPLSPGEFGRSDRKSVRPAERAPETRVSKVRSARSSTGILDRLRLRWLRQAFSIRVDEL
jgi:hypothetical protein